MSGMKARRCQFLFGRAAPTTGLWKDLLRRACRASTPFAAVLAVVVFAPRPCLAQANSWIGSTGGKWEDASNWSLGIAPTDLHSVFITNTDSKTVMIDATTTNSATTMAISNLTVSAVSPSTNTLRLLNPGLSTALRIKNTLAVRRGGELLLTNAALVVEGVGGGPYALSTVVDGAVGLESSTMTLGLVVIGSVANANGTLTVSGGTVSGSYFTVGDQPNSTGTVWIAGGQLTQTMGTMDVGRLGRGELVLSNGTVSAGGPNVGSSSGAVGTLTVAGGTFVGSGIRIAYTGGTGTVWVTGGQLLASGGEPEVGGYGVGLMVISNGLVQSGSDLIVGYANIGTLTLAGGTLAAGLNFGMNGGKGYAWLQGGEMLATNPSANVGISRGRLVVSNATVIARAASVGTGFNNVGSISIDGGTVTVLTALSLGTCAFNSTGMVSVTGGALLVTNVSHSAELQINSGTVTVSGGRLTVDKLVITNACGRFIKAGGDVVITTLLLGSALDADGDGLPNGWEQSHGLDPLDANGINGAYGDPDGDGMSNLQEYLAGTDPTNSASFFGITAVAPEGNDVRVTWMTGIGRTNALQATTGDAHGSYSNNFADIFSVTGATDSVTNYLDLDAATNSPSRYYRVRLVP